MGEGALHDDADECFSQLQNGARHVRENPDLGGWILYCQKYMRKGMSRLVA